MKFSFNWIKQYIDIKETPHRVAQLLTRHSFEVEEVIKEDNDFIFDIDILPNRLADASSHLGVAREMATLLDVRLKEPKLLFKEDPHFRVREAVKIKILKPSLCPRYSARVINDIRVGESPAWLKGRLASIGVKPINNIVDAANYVMLEMGQPLHAFDLNKIASSQIVVRAAKKGETIKTLDGQVFSLGPDNLVVADAAKALAIAGVKGGESSGVSEKTKTVLIESANFDQASIRNTSKRLNLKTDASIRFSVGLSPSLTTAALERVCSLILEISGGRVFSDVYDVGQAKEIARGVKFSLIEAEEFLGLKLDAKKVEKILTSLGCRVRVNKAIDSGANFVAILPAFRLDLERKEDVFEEIGRVWGYQKIKARPPMALLKPLEPNHTREFRLKVKDIISSLGFYEVVNYIFEGEPELQLLGLGPKAAWLLANPISQDKKYLRQSLILGLLKNAKTNFRVSDSFSLFEVGKVYFKISSRPQESWNLAMLVFERNPSSADGSFFKLKGSVEKFLTRIGIFDAWFSEKLKGGGLSNLFHPQRAAVVKTEDSKTIGVLGELHPAVQEQLGIKGKVVVVSFNLDFLEEVAEVDTLFQELPKYPPVKRDIAFLVNEAVKLAEAENVIYNSGAVNLVDVDLFDIYEDPANPSVKSLAFHLIFQSENKTLSDREVDANEAKIKAALIKKLRAEIR